VAHLEVCRTTAEPFNPNDIGRYKEIQDRRRRQTDWDIEKNVVVIHAEAQELPTQTPFVAHINIEPTAFDSYFQIEGALRLFLHPPGSLARGKAVDFRKASLYLGEITAVVRTERHPKNRGARGDFLAANYDIVALDTSGSVPLFVAAGQMNVNARTQVVARIDDLDKVGNELFSLESTSPVQNVLQSKEEEEFDEVDDDMRSCFTRESIAGNRLLYRPATGVKEVLRITGHEETVHAMLPEEFKDKLLDAQDHVQYQATEPVHPLAPFFFLSKYVVRRREEP
jgi:hypothetical protein